MTTAPYVSAVTDEPMAGFENAKALVCTFLQETLPLTIEALRTLLNIPAPSPISNLMPEPEMYVPYEPPALDAETLANNYPFNANALLYVSCLDMNKLEEVNVDDAGNAYYDAWYPMNVICWVKSQTWEQAIQARNNLMVAIRTAILRSRGLNAPTVVRIDANTWQDRAAEPAELARGNRYLAGGVCSFTLVVRETLLLPPIGTAETFPVALDQLARSQYPAPPMPHPALD